MRSEIAAQLAYTQRLARALGVGNALRFRAMALAAKTRLSVAETIRMAPSCLDHPVELRLASTDPEVYGQVITAAEYAAAILPDARVIVDCGANIGLTSAFFLSRMTQARVIAIEPFPANAALCRRNLAPYGGRAEVVEGAIWNGTTLLNLQAATGDEWGVKVAAGPGGSVRAFDIPSLGLPRIDLLKVDIEGAEAVLFDASAQDWLPSVRNIVIESHGEACEARFRKALAGYRYEERRSGELTVCLSLERKGGEDAPLARRWAQGAAQGSLG